MSRLPFKFTPKIMGETEAAAAASNRHEENVVAEYLFDEGAGSVVSDQRADPYDLNIANIDNVTWGTDEWGGYLQLNSEVKVVGTGGFEKFVTGAQGATAASIEAWVAVSGAIESSPGAADNIFGPARMINCSNTVDSTTSRNFLIGINFFPAAAEQGVARVRWQSSVTDGDGLLGGESLATNENVVKNDELYHMVATFGGNNGLKLYINNVTGDFGQTLVEDVNFAGDLSDWDPTYDLLLGTEHGATRTFLGKYYRMAFHAEELTNAQVEQNFYALPAGDGVLPSPSVSWLNSVESINEWENSGTATLRLSAAFGSAVNIPIGLNGTSQIYFDSSHTLTGTTVQFDAGETSKDVTLYVQNTSSGPGETGSLVAFTGDGVTLGSIPVVRVTAVSDNVAPSVSWSQATYTTPTTGIAELGLVADRNYFGSVTPSVSVVWGSTTMATGNWTLPSDTVFPRGSTETTYDVSFSAEDGEVLALSIDSVSPGTTGHPFIATVTADNLQFEKPGPNNTGPNSQAYIDEFGSAQTLTAVSSFDLTDAWIVANCQDLGGGEYLYENFTTSAINVDEAITLNVTFRNFVLDVGGGFYCVNAASSSLEHTANITFEHGRMTNSVSAGVILSANTIHPIGTGPRWFLKNLEIDEHGADGVKLKRNCDMRKCWVHHIGTNPGSHADGNQTQAGTNGNVSLIGNFFDMPVPESDDGPGSPYASNAASINQAKPGHIVSFRMEYNWLDGGNYTVYYTTSDTDGILGTIDNVTLIGNRFGRNFRYGLVSFGGATSLTNTDFRDNVWDDTGELVVTVANGGTAESNYNWAPPGHVNHVVNTRNPNTNQP